MKVIKWLSGIFILALILIVIIANLGLGSEYFPFIYIIPGLDKIGHFLLMGILSLLINLLYKSKSVRILKLNIHVGSLLVAAVVAMEELSQIFLVYRAFSWMDLAFDLAGIFLGGQLASLLNCKPESEG